jgi:hypothetical protein
MSRPAATVPRLALDVSEACASLGVSWDYFVEYVAPELRIVRRGRRKLIALTELERWLDANAERVLPEANGMSTRSSAKTPANQGVRASCAPARKAAA